MATSARQIIQTFLDEYGLGALGEWAWNLYTTSGAGDINEFVRGQLSVEIPKTEAFKNRFPAYEQLIAQGRGISVDQYRQYEKDITETAHSFGLPAAMFEDRAYVAQMMVSNVSANEFAQRAAINRDAAYNAPQEVRDELVAMYGYAEGMAALTAIYFDPEKSVPVLQQQFQTAQVAAAGLMQGVTVSRETAERLSQQGVSWEQAQAGFRQVAQDQALAAAPGDSIGQDQATAAAFGDAGAQAEVARVRRTRSAAFQGGGGVAESQTGVRGLGSTSR